MKGKIVLLPFPFTDLSASKYRPELVLYEDSMDVIVAFISSRIPSKLGEADVFVGEEHGEFAQTGLKTSSVIKLSKIATILKDLVMGELGEVGPSLKDEINAKLKRIFRL
jgi:mRNA interferase MazF